MADITIPSPGYGTAVLKDLKGDGSIMAPLHYAETRGNTRRSAGVVHRNAITAVDKLATPAAPTVADVASGGSLAQGTQYFAAVAAGTIHGTTPGSSTGNVTTAASGGSVHAVNITIAQVANAAYYDIFMSTAANPLWVARVTETQRAAGVTVTAVGTVTGTSPGAGIVQVQVVGTGLANNVAPFTVNNAYVTAGITPIDCSGYGIVIANWRLAVTDLRSIPTLALAAFWLDNQSQEYRFFGNTVGPAPTILTAVRQPLSGVLQFNTLGTSSMMVLVDTISGQGSAVSINVELA